MSSIVASKMALPPNGKIVPDGKSDVKQISTTPYKLLTEINVIKGSFSVQVTVM